MKHTVVETKLTGMELFGPGVRFLRIEKAWTPPSYCIQDNEGIFHYYFPGTWNRVGEIAEHFNEIARKHLYAKTVIVCDRFVPGLHYDPLPVGSTYDPALRACLSALLLLIQQGFALQRSLLEHPERIIIITTHSNEITVHEGLGDRIVMFLHCMAPSQPTNPSRRVRHLRSLPTIVPGEDEER